MAPCRAVPYPPLTAEQRDAVLASFAGFASSNLVAADAAGAEYRAAA